MHRSYFIAMWALLLAGCSSQPNGSRNVEVTWGLDVIGAAEKDPKNVVLPILKTEMDGFVEDVSEYRAWAAKRRSPNGRLIATVPSAGTYYPAFIFYDGAGDERVSVSIDGQEAGVAVADDNDNRQKLFFLPEPRTFRGGEKLELRALTADGLYRTENLLLLASKPEAKRRTFRISSLAVTPAEEAAAVTWLTDWPAVCRLEGDAGAAKEEIAFNNHRLILRTLSPDRNYRVRVVAATPTGESVSSEWMTFRTAKTTVAAERIGKDTVALKLEPGQLPVTAGIPFAKGALQSVAHLRVVDAQSREAPLQTRVLQRWTDGSVKWALLDFAGSSTTATVEYGGEISQTRVESPLRVTDRADSVSVDTGRVRFTISKKQFGLLDSVWLDGERIVDKPSVFALAGSDGSVYTSLAAPEEVVVEESGPVRATLRISGHHQDAAGKRLFGYSVRIHAWAGQPYVRVQHTVENDQTASDFTSIKSLSLEMPLAGDGKQWSLGGQSGTFRNGEAVVLKQHTDDRYSITPTGGGKRAAGWAEWSDGGHTVTLAVRDFWQNYPKDLAVRPGGFELALFPPLRTDEYDSANGTIDQHRLYYYLQGGAYKLRQGVTKTHDFWLEFGKKAPAAIRAEQHVRTAAAPATWYARSEVFGELSVPKPEGILKQYDQAFTQSFAGYLRDREQSREYGLLNFGDWWGERVINWGNSEYDTQHSFLLQFARTGDFRYFRAAEEMEWHNRDIDAIHHHADPIMKGAVYAHAIGHTGDYYATRPTAGAPKGGFASGSPKSHFAVDHTFIEGHFDYYFLTGDRRSYDTALSTADRYNSYFTRNYDFNNCRQPGWHLILAMAAYNATNDPYYLNAAKMVVERVLERQTPNGGWKRQMVPGHCFCTPRHEGNAGFMVGVLLTGMRHYHEATRDERVADSIVKGAHFLIDDMWVPEARGFHYTSCPKSVVGAWSNFLLFDGIVFAHRRTGEEKLRQVLVAGTDGALDAMSGNSKREGAAWGKGFTQFTRVVPHFIDHLALLKGQGRGSRPATD